jgi:uncharacterized protein (DUF1697 family)
MSDRPAPGPARYALLLRAINVGGRKLPMAQLRELLSELGHTEVSTILASGQAVVTSDRAGAEIAAELEQQLAVRFGLRAEVMVRSGAQLAAIAAGTPYPQADQDGARHAVVFLRAPATGAQLARLTGGDWGRDEFTVRGAEIYLRLPDGFADSKLAVAVGAIKGVPATTRNWNTVLKLVAATR